MCCIDRRLTKWLEAHPDDWYIRPGIYLLICSPLYLLACLTFPCLYCFSKFFPHDRVKRNLRRRPYDNVAARLEAPPPAAPVRARDRCRKPTHSQQQSLLFRLPVELRARIWHNCLADRFLYAPWIEGFGEKLRCSSYSYPSDWPATTHVRPAGLGSSSPWLGGKFPGRLSNWKGEQLLQTCQRIDTETRDLLVAGNTFAFETPLELSLFRKQLGVRRWNTIRYLQFQIFPGPALQAPRSDRRTWRALWQLFGEMASSGSTDGGSSSSGGSRYGLRELSVQLHVQSYYTMESDFLTAQVKKNPELARQSAQAFFDGLAEWADDIAVPALRGRLAQASFEHHGHWTSFMPCDVQSSPERAWLAPCVEFAARLEEAQKLITWARDGSLAEIAP